MLPYSEQMEAISMPCNHSMLALRRHPKIIVIVWYAVHRQIRPANVGNVFVHPTPTCLIPRLLTSRLLCLQSVSPRCSTYTNDSGMQAPERSEKQLRFGAWSGQTCNQPYLYSKRSNLGAETVEYTREMVTMLQLQYFQPYRILSRQYLLWDSAPR